MNESCEELRLQAQQVKFLEEDKLANDTRQIGAMKIDPP